MKLTFGGSAALALALAGLSGVAGCQKAATNTAAPPAVAASAPPAAGAAAPASGDAADVKAFLDSLYAHYKTSSSNSTFQPFDANAGEVLDADTIALMKADEKALKGELGDIDGDWICDCQDYQSITATVAVLSATPTSAKATADFHDVIDTSPKPHRDTFDLVKTPAGWRIHDMGTSDQPSLRKVLQDEIARLKAGGKPAGGGDWGFAPPLLSVTPDGPQGRSGAGPAGSPATSSQGAARPAPGSALRCGRGDGFDDR